MGNLFLDNSKQVTDLGLTPPLYEEKETVQEKDNSFYASMLLAPEKGIDPVELYNSINEEIVNYGYSDLITEAKTKWKEEQDEDNALYLNEVIENPNINVLDKKQELLRYIKKPTSNSLKEKYIQKLNNSYILDNSLETNDNYISADEEIEQLQWEQAFETIETEQKKVINKEPSPEFDESKALDTIDRVMTGFNDPGYIPVVDDIAFLGSMIVHLPDYFWELVDTWAAAALGVDIPNVLDRQNFGGDANAAKAETVTKMRELVIKNRKTTFTKQTAEGLDSLLRVAGIDVSKFSLVGKAFEYLGQAIGYVSENTTPDDPGKTSLVLETLLLIFGPKGIRAAKRKIKGAFGKKVPEYKETEPNAPFKKEVKKPDLFEYLDEDGTLIRREIVEILEKDGAKLVKLVKDSNPYKNKTYQRFENGKVIKQGTKIETITFKNNPPVAPEQSNPKVNTPFASTNRTNPEAGNKLQDAIIQEPSIGEQIGFNVDQMALKFIDSTGNVYKSADVGVTVDFGHLRALKNEAAKELRLLLLEPADPNYAPKKAYLEKIFDTTKDILEQESLVLASSINKLVPVGDGFDFGVAFRKSANSDFINPNEVMSVYTAFKEKLLLEKGFKKTDLEIVDKAPDGTPISKEYLNFEDVFKGNRLEIHEVAKRDSSFTPIEIYKNGRIPVERLDVGPTNTAFIIRWSEESSFTNMYRGERIRETESARHSGPSWIEDVVGDAVP